MKKEAAVLAMLVLTLLFIDYNFIDSGVEGFFNEEETGVVERIVDGDTLIINGNSTRLLGINTPERGEVGYLEAKEFLGFLVNQSVNIRFGKERYDKYGRSLAYIIFEERNINVEIVKNGFANTYIHERDIYSDDLEEAWESCNKNLCEKSSDKCAGCIKLKEIDLDEQKVVIENVCNFNCNLKNWSIKDEGRKKFVFGEIVLKNEISIIVGNESDTEDKLYWNQKDYVWTETGDTLFLRDAERKLVLWEKI